MPEVCAATFVTERVLYRYPFLTGLLQKKRGGDYHLPLHCFSRDDRTRTGDPYVPNVVRYQLRYIPITACKGTLKI